MPDSVTIHRMPSWLRILALTTALLGMPLQGVAAALSPLLCDSEAQAHTVHANGGHHLGSHQDGGQDNDNAGGGSGFHPCSNTVSATLSATLLAATPDFPVGAFAPDTSYDPYIPEQPQRPPLV